MQAEGFYECVQGDYIRGLWVTCRSGGVSEAKWILSRFMRKPFGNNL